MMNRPFKSYATSIPTLASDSPSPRLGASSGAHSRVAKYPAIPGASNDVVYFIGAIGALTMLCAYSPSGYAAAKAKFDSNAAAGGPTVAPFVKNLLVWVPNVKGTGSWSPTPKMPGVYIVRELTPKSGMRLSASSDGMDLELSIGTPVENDPTYITPPPDGATKDTIYFVGRFGYSTTLAAYSPSAWAAAASKIGTSPGQTFLKNIVVWWPGNGMPMWSVIKDLPGLSIDTVLTKLPLGRTLRRNPATHAVELVRIATGVAMVSGGGDVDSDRSKVARRENVPAGLGNAMAKTAAHKDPYYKPLTRHPLTPAVAMAHNVRTIAGPPRKPATLSCPEGEALYQGKCIPKSRVRGGTLAQAPGVGLGKPAATKPATTKTMVHTIAKSAHAKPAMYVVARNDTTSGIAQKLGVPVSALLAANPSLRTMQLKSGAMVFSSLQEKQKINVPRRPAMMAGGVGLGDPGVLGAAQGESCDYTTWCDAGLSCQGGTCQPDGSAPITGGLSNEGSYCDAGGGPQSGYISNGACVPLGGSTTGASGNSITGNVVCPGPNMQVSIQQMACICEDGFVPDPNGPGCVSPSTPGATATGALLCEATGGSGTDQNCSCPTGYSWDTNNGCVDSSGKAGGVVGGKTGGTGGGGGGGGGTTTKPGTTTPGTGAGGATTSLTGGKISTPWLVAGVVAVATVVGGGAFAAAKMHKKAKAAKGGKKDEKKLLKKKGSKK